MRPLAALLLAALPALAQDRATKVEIRGTDFFLNGRPTYAGRTWEGARIEGLLLNSRMVQGIFDDLNPATVARWAYPDTGRWDPERNTREFIAAMPAWRAHGLLAFTINLQGGSPLGYSREQPWENSAFAPDGTLRPAYLNRLARILDRADQLGLVAIVGYFYFGQDQRLQDEAAVRRATDAATAWLLDGGWTNVLVEIDNECDMRYDHAILKPERVHELIERVQATTRGQRRLLVSTSYGGNTVPHDNVVRAADYLLLHGNGVRDPKRITEMVEQTRAVPGYTPKPILFNEDDHFAFDQPVNNFVAAVRAGASWGYFDYRMKDEGPADGFQSVPVDWSISSPRKRGFFELVARITDSAPCHAIALPGIENVFELTGQVFSGGTPNGEAAFAALAARGVKTIVSVDGARPDIATARRHGLSYVHLPHGYDGVPSRVAELLAKAGATLPGPFFIHCHHGRHRGPAAAAVLCRATAGWSAAAAETFLHVAGTASEYQGLYESVRDFQPPDADRLARLPAAFPAVADTSTLVDSMVAIDEVWDRLKEWPAQRDRAAATRDAALLREHYRELQRLPSTPERGPDFLAALREAEMRADHLRVQFASPPGPREDTLPPALASAGESCQTCHRTHRNRTPKPPR